MEAYFGNPNIKRQGDKARLLAQQRDVNTLPDPRTFAAVSGLLGNRPDQLGFSAMHPDAEGIRSAGESGLAMSLLTAMAPLTKGLPIGGSIKNVSKPFVYPQDAAIATAQRNAALPMEKGGLGLRADNTPMERAGAMGFDTDAYHGTNKTNIKSLNRSEIGAQGPGVYLGDHPMVGNAYSGDGKGANVIPALLHGKYAGNMEFSKEVGTHGWKGVEDALKASGHSGIHDTMFESAYNVFKPSDIRSRFAAFDPMRRNEPDLLAGALPFTALADEDMRARLENIFKR